MQARVSMGADPRDPPDSGHGQTEPGGQALAHTATSEATTAPTSGSQMQPPGEGTRIGRFVLLEKIGEGGMGVVYAALDEELDRKIAIKLLLPGLSKGRARLLREARSMAKLTHPNVVTVHDVGTFQDRVYVAMEFVEGGSLREWVQDKDWRATIQLFLQAADGLSAAHAAGIVHRDFKPDNVLVGNDGRVRVLDFGLAKPARPEAPPPGTDAERHSAREPEVEPPLQHQLTQTGAMMGTPAYMAPEQFLGTGADPRTDQFSFAVTLYETLFGMRPFDGKTFTELGHAVLDGRVRPPPEGSVPTRVRTAIVRALAPKREDRFASMDELSSELRQALEQPDGARRNWWPSLWRTSAVVGVAALVIGGLWYQTQSSDGPTAVDVAALEGTAGPGSEPGAGQAEGGQGRAGARRSRSRKQGAGGPGPQAPTPLPSVEDCPDLPLPPRQPARARRQLALLGNLLASSAAGSKEHLRVLTDMAHEHLRAGDKAAACTVLRRFLSETSAGHPKRSDMRCLSRQLGCSNRMAKAAAAAAPSEADADADAGSTARQADARDSTLQRRERACELGHAQSCIELGDALLAGEGVERDGTKAVTMYTRACRLGSRQGCARQRGR